MLRLIRSVEHPRFTASMARSRETILQLESELDALKRERQRRAYDNHEGNTSQASKKHPTSQLLGEGFDHISITRYHQLKWWKSCMDEEETCTFQDFCDVRKDGSDSSIQSSNDFETESTAPTSVLFNTSSKDQGCIPNDSEIESIAPASIFFNTSSKDQGCIPQIDSSSILPSQVAQQVNEPPLDQNMIDYIYHDHSMESIYSDSTKPRNGTSMTPARVLWQCASQPILHCKLESSH